MKCLSRFKFYLIQLFGFFYFWSISAITFADGIIPISYNDETQSGTDFANTFLKIFKNDGMPILEYGSAIVIVYFAITGILKGHRESQVHPDSEAFKSACLRAVALIVVGGALIYILKQIGDNIPTS